MADHVHQDTDSYMVVKVVLETTDSSKEVLSVFWGTVELTEL